MTKKRWWAPLVAAVVTLGLAVPLGGTAAYAQSAALDVTPLAAGDVVGSLTLVGTEAMAGLSTGTDAKVPTNGGWAKYKLSVTSVPGVQDVTFTTTLPEGWYTTKAANPQFDSSPNWAYYITSVYSDCVAVGTIEHCRTITTTVHNMQPDTTFTADFTAWTDTTRVNPVIQGAETGSTWQPTFAWTGGIGNIVADKPVTVVSIPTGNTGKSGVVDAATVQRDFGSGLEDARSFSFSVATGGLNGKGQRPAKIQLPAKLTDTWTVTGADKQIVELVSFTPGGAAAVECSGMTCGSAATVSNMTLTATGGSMDIAFNANADGYGSLAYKVFVPAAQLDEAGTIKMTNVISPVDWKEAGSGVALPAPDRASAPVMNAPTGPPPPPQYVQTVAGFTHAGRSFMPTQFGDSVPALGSGDRISSNPYGSWSVRYGLNLPSSDLVTYYPGSNMYNMWFYHPPGVIEEPGEPAIIAPEQATLYGFWDVTREQMDTAVAPWASLGGTNNNGWNIAEHPEDFTFQFYGGQMCSTPAAAAAADPSTLVWADTPEAAGGADKVCGYRMTYSGSTEHYPTLPYNSANQSNQFGNLHVGIAMVAGDYNPVTTNLWSMVRDEKNAPAQANVSWNGEEWETVNTLSPVAPAPMQVRNFIISAPIGQVDPTQTAYQGDWKEYQATPVVTLYPRTEGGDTELRNLSMSFKFAGTMAGFEITDTPDGWQCITDGNNSAGYTVTCTNPGPVTLTQEPGANYMPNQLLPPVKFAVLYDFIKTTATGVTAGGTITAQSEVQEPTSGVVSGAIVAPQPPQSNSMFKSANGPAEVVLPGSSLSWQNNWRTQQVLNTTQCIGDALPFVGDGRGTTGKFEFTGAAIVPGSKFTGGRLMYTTAPSATVQAAVNANNFCANGALNWSAELPDPASSVTGVMVEFASAVSGDAGAYTVTGTAVNPKVGDKFGNDSRVTTANINTDSVVLEIVKAPAPSVSVHKTGLLAGPAEVGSPVKWTITISNTSLVDFTSVELDDPLLAGSDLVWSPATVPTQGLAKGLSATVTGTTVLTQEMIDAGKVVNTATVNVTTAAGATAAGTDTAEVVLPATPSFEVSKTGRPTWTGLPKNQDQVSWTITGMNTGNVMLTNVTLADELLDAGATYNWPGTPGQLRPGQQVSLRGTTTLSQATIDAGFITNSATGQGVAGTVTVEDTASQTIEWTNAESINVQKNGTVAGPVKAGQKVIWTILVQNTGSATLSSVELEDSLGATEWTSWPGSEEGVGAEGFTLAPGDDATATLVTTLTQEDIEAGSVVNEVTVTATTPSDDTVTDSDVDTVEFSATSGLNLSKSATLNGFVLEGTEIDWFFTVQNTGNTILTAVEITDEFEGLSELTWGTWPGAVGVLAPGDIVRAQATSTLTQAQIDAGVVENDATATGEGRGGPVTSSDTAQLNLGANAVIDLEETGELLGEPVFGGEVVWTQTITNLGNVTLFDVVLTEGDAPVAAAARLAAREVDYTFGEWPGVEGQLAPGESVTAQLTKALTVTEIAAGRATHLSQVTAAGPGEDQEATDSAIADVEWEPIITPGPETVVPGGGLPSTGGTIPTVLITVAAWMLAAGLLLVLIKRRRREHEAQ